MAYDIHFQNPEKFSVSLKMTAVIQNKPVHLFAPDNDSWNAMKALYTATSQKCIIYVDRVCKRPTAKRRRTGMLRHLYHSFSANTSFPPHASLFMSHAFAPFLSSFFMPLNQILTSTSGDQTFPTTY